MNNRHPLTADHRIWLGEYIVDLDRVLPLLPDDYAVEHFTRLRDIARYLPATR